MSNLNIIASAFSHYTLSGLVVVSKKPVHFLMRDIKGVDLERKGGGEKQGDNSEGEL